VLEKYQEQAKLVFKNWPLETHEYAMRAAIAALAAHRQGKFWEFHDLLFRNYQQLSDQKIQEIVKELDLDIETFEKDMEDPSIGDTIRVDIQDGIHAGVQGVPTIFINGRLLKNRSMQGLQAVIEKELKEIKK
jgi:protein-disulfide isomerase